MVNQLAGEWRNAAPGSVELRDVLIEHLGTEPDELPTIGEDVPAHRLTDIDIALSAVADADPDAKLVGVRSMQRHHSSLQDLVSDQPGMSSPVGAVEYANLPTGPDSERAVVAFGVRLFRYRGQPVAVLQRAANPQYGSMSARVEVVASDRELVAALLAEIRALAVERSVLRGQVVSLTANEYGPSAGGVTFVARPDIPADRVVLPEGTLDRIHRHVLSLATVKAQLQAAGQHLKRGVLLYGPPGTGKTHTVRHLIGSTPDTTVLLLTGSSLGFIGEAAAIARAHQPAMVVLEDVDLIAMDRHFDAHGPKPLLFELLDAMDGLDTDADVVFLLTTNRVDLLEQALAQRPGRVDLAVEVPLPDRDARAQLVRLYAGELPFSDQAIDRWADQSEGATASFAKEAVRRTVLRAALAGHPPTDDDLLGALADLNSDAERLSRSLMGVGGDDRASFDPDDPVGFGPEPGLYPGVTFASAAAPTAYSSTLELTFDEPGRAGANADPDPSAGSGPSVEPPEPAERAERAEQSKPVKPSPPADSGEPSAPS